MTHVHPLAASDSPPVKALTPDEDRARTNVHYMLPARFFELLTGGQWHVYSCNIWAEELAAHVNDFSSQTRSQEAKLDVFARMAELEEGSRVLDVGAGWGGPLIYLCKTYGAIGEGLMLSANQVEYASAWAEREGVRCTFHLAHWDEFRPTSEFDAIITDEAIVHFERLKDFFDKAFCFLAPRGVMINKELHYAHPDYASERLPGGRHLEKVYGGPDSYRTLAEELELTYRAGFMVEEVFQLAAHHYVSTATAWKNNLRAHRNELTALVGEAVYADYMKYLWVVIHMFTDKPKASLRLAPHFVKSRKLPKAT